jgi:homoserine dehydrogenase
VQEVLVHDYNEIVNDPEVDIVVEVMGGIEPAFTFVKKALLAGKNVCTSNKALVAKHGTELLRLAKENKVNFLFEASCGGGIPIIRALNSSLTADVIDEITGILNGTTNYMLDKMSTEGSEFDTVLKEAQAMGYAEADPTADVEGYDACRKIAILSSIAYGKFIDYENVYTEGITKITPEDMEYAQKLGMTIKLLATSRKVGEDSFYAMVAPFLVGPKNPLYSVNDVFNSVFVHGNMLGDAMFYGSGAGKLPTASAVVADVVDEAKHLHEDVMASWSEEPLKLLEMDEVSGRFFVRAQGVSAETVKEAFGEVQIAELPSLPDELAFVTSEMTQGEYNAKAQTLGEHVLTMIRVKD